MQDISTELLRNAISAHRKGDYPLAEELYRDVISNSPENLDALHYLGVLFISNEQPLTAIPLLAKAVSINCNNPDILYNLALAHQKANNINEAVHYYKLVISINSDYILAYNNLGVAYQHIGNLDKANYFLERAFTISPTYADAYYNFVQSNKFNNTDSKFVRNIENLLNNNSWNKIDEIKLNFSLGKIYDDLSNYNIAFQYYEKANNLKNQGFDIKRFGDYIDKIIDHYSASLIQGFKNIDRPENSIRFIFILGMPRSGTTLTEQIIAAHPQIHDGGEIGFIGDIVDDFSEIIGSNKPYPDCLQSLVEDHILNISTAIYKKIDEQALSQYIITDKSPVNFLHVGLIKILFPNSTIIQCNRNPIDTCLSCFFQNFDKQHHYTYDLKTVALFHNQYSRLMNHWKSIFPDQIIETQYEELVSNQLVVSKSLVEKCDLEWNNKCLSFYKSKSVINTASKWQVRRPIYNTSVNKWKNYQPFINKLVDNLKT